MSEETVLAKNFARFSDSGIAAYPQTARSHIQGLIGLCESKESELSLMRERMRELEGALIEIRNDAIWCKENAHDDRLEAYIETCDKALLSTGSAGG